MIGHVLKDLWESPDSKKSIIGSFSNRTSDDDLGAGGIVWILFYFDHIWVFALCTPSSSEVPVDLISPPYINCKNVLTEANSSLKSNFESCHLSESSRWVIDLCLSQRL